MAWFGGYDPEAMTEKEWRRMHDVEEAWDTGEEPVNPCLDCDGEAMQACAGCKSNPDKRLRD